MRFCLFASMMLAVSAFASPLSGNQRSKCENDGSAPYVNITTSTSPFEKIMNVRITTPDAVHSTPAIVFVGTDSKLLRCLYEDPNECEVFFNTDNKVNSLLISGEYIYAGLDSKILRCNLNQIESCEDFQTGCSSVFSLASADKYLYAGLYSGAIIRCVINEPGSCQVLVDFNNQVYSLILFNEYIYAGLWGNQLMRCSFSTISTCSLLYRMSEGVMGLANVENSIFAVTWDGLTWNCTEKSDAEANYCESVPLHYTRPYGIASFNDNLYTIQEDMGIYKCNWSTNMDCAGFGNNNKARSMAFAYGTYQMQGRYRNEDTDCVWQSESKCPPFVTYYNAQNRAKLEVNVIGGRLYNSLGVLVDTSNADEGRSGPAAIFAMGPEGKLLVSNRHIAELLHTSSLFAGNWVSGAGEMIVKDGVIQQIRACSDHYQPDVNLNRQVIQSLRVQGYTEHIDSVMCSEDEQLDPTESKNTQ